ncbi:metallophosphoesterase [Sinomicrobium sp. M5D2P9]
MRILHLTDFHFDGSNKYKENELRTIESLLEALKDYKNKIDLVFFTGDLVWSGDDCNRFKRAKEIFLDRLANILEIDITSIFICPGNHDVYRGQELEELTASILGISDSDELDNLVTKNNGKTLQASLENLENYFTFQNEFYKDHIDRLGDIEVDNLYTTHIRIIEGKKVGITTINSAWRANDSNTDFGNLLYPIHYLKNAIRKVKECDIKILMLHHPLTDFKYWNRFELEDIIFKDYDLMFSGHVHNNRDTVHITADIGIYHCTSAATLSSKNDSIGFTIVDLNQDSYELEITNAIFNRNEEQFYFGKPKLAEIPLNENKREQNKFRKTIRKRFEEKLKEANKLFLTYQEIKEENNFIKLFSTPIIKNESQSNPKPKSKKLIDLGELIRNKSENQVLFGKDKSGKSAILYKIFIDILQDFNDLKTLPLLIDCKSIVKSSTKIDVIDLLSDLYEMNKRKAEELSKTYHIKILLDDFKGNEELVLTPLSNYLSQNNASLILACNETVFYSFAGGIIGTLNFVNRYIHDITRAEIRMLTQKWPNLSQNKKEKVLDKINTVFNQLNIPSNYWTVSLFIWIFEKNIDVNLGNNFQLIELYIDSLLDKENFILSNQYKIDFDDLKDFLSYLAYYLITNKTSNTYQVNYSEFIAYIETYKKSNKRFVIDTRELADLLINKGIIKRNLSDDLYTFRLNGVFEYFLGYYMAYDEDFRNQLIDDEHLYLSFRNEFEVCAGLIPQDYKFVKKIFKKTKSIYKETNKNIETNDLDSLLLGKVSETFNISGGVNQILKETIKDSLDLEEQDSILETLSPSSNRVSDVKLKKYYHEIGNNSDDLENALYILGRVFRNSKLKNREDFNDKVFDFVLNSTCTFSLSLIDEISSQNFNEMAGEITEEQLIKLLTQFLPIVAQTLFFDIAIQTNLETVLIEKINVLKQNKNGNELKLLILFFSLIDLDVKNHSNYIEELIDLINIPILKQTTVFKLYLYLSFKCNGNKNLRSKIEKLIKKQELKIDSSQNIGALEQRIKLMEKSMNKNKDLL